MPLSNIFSITADIVVQYRFAMLRKNNSRFLEENHFPYNKLTRTLLLL